MSVPVNMLGNTPGNSGNQLALDSQNLDSLRLQAKQEPGKALKVAAKQFETVFMNMMLKSMRDATPQDGVFDSEQTKMFTSMLDQQLAENMGNRGVGLADIMVKQLSRQMPAVEAAEAASVTPSIAEAAPPASRQAAPQPNPALAVSAPAKNSLPSAYNENFQQDFVQRLLPHAEKVSRETGLPAHMMLGQAALESGWGRRAILMADGTDSHNLFGIKAGANWNGKVAEVKTTEYHNGVASKPTEKFRAYDSYADAFRDYAKLLSGNERYADVLSQGGDAHGFAQALQDSGYATDPRYAEKLVKVIGKVNTLA
ncbi:MAG TPA: flagellar assembly peptidoglycan hydrolase FlgJ [Gallionellaceae bacterium]|nr:flagellar assembly peptidoglycan hydrolase FlgJ [Gallionellaceae bacterium]